MPIESTSIAGPMSDFGVRGAEWSMPAVPTLGGSTHVERKADGHFGGMLVDRVGDLAKTQAEAAQSARSLADGTATDVSDVVIDVERARLAMQLASQIRTKGVEAFQDIFHTQV